MKTLILIIAACSALAACEPESRYSGNGYSRTGTGSVDSVHRNQANGGSR